MSVVRIIGIDPGLRHTGWGIIEADGSRLSYIADGAVHSVNEDDLAVRLLQIHQQILQYCMMILKDYQMLREPCLMRWEKK